MNRECLVTIFDKALEPPRALTVKEAGSDGFAVILTDFASRLAKGIDFYQCLSVEDLPLVDSVIIVRGQLTNYYKDVSGIEHTRFISVDSESDAHIKLNDILFVCSSKDRKEYTVYMYLEALSDCVVLSEKEKLILTRHLVV
ncbi:MAG: hypothetical protein M0Z41_07025 [Peptococcaceae bacterium]|jgi:hypothetical protein|nr:hypothetical protein [Peptococcaceae bacterium]